MMTLTLWDDEDERELVYLEVIFFIFSDYIYMLFYILLYIVYIGHIILLYLLYVVCMLLFYVFKPLPYPCCILFF